MTGFSKSTAYEYLSSGRSGNILKKSSATTNHCAAKIFMSGIARRAKPLQLDARVDAYLDEIEKKPDQTIGLEDISSGETIGGWLKDWRGLLQLSSVDRTNLFCGTSVTRLALLLPASNLP